MADDDPLRLMYTSGTESRPKGVLLPSRSLISQYVSCVIDGEMAADDVEAHSLPMYHCAQLDCFFSVDVYLGATSIILPAPDPAALLATIEREKVTKLFCPPTVWISLLRHADFDTRDLSSLRKGYYGASPMPVEVLKRARTAAARRAVLELLRPDRDGPIGHDPAAPRAGEPRRIRGPGVDQRRDDVGQRRRRAGADGRGRRDRPPPPHATLGYYENEEKTAEAFSGGWFHSGDLGVMDEDGYLSVVDRKKDMIKTGGENVASPRGRGGDLRARRRRRGRGVRDQPPHVDRGGDGGRRGEVRAWSSTEDDVHAHASAKLAGYKRPKYVVLADALPKNPSGKILKRELRDQHADLAKEA